MTVSVTGSGRPEKKAETEMSKWLVELQLALATCRVIADDIYDRVSGPEPAKDQEDKLEGPRGYVRILERMNHNMQALMERLRTLDQLI